VRTRFIRVYLSLIPSLSTIAAKERSKLSDGSEEETPKRRERPGFGKTTRRAHLVMVRRRRTEAWNEVLAARLLWELERKPGVGFMHTRSLSLNEQKRKN